MAKGSLYALASAGCATLAVVGFVLYVNLGSGVLLLALLMAPIVLCGLVVAHDVMTHRAANAGERLRLARERDRVRRTVDLVTDPALTDVERLAVIDCFIPRLGRKPARSPYRDRFVVVDELSPPSRALLERARAAVMSVYTSQVMRRRLLDDLANESLLPRQLWEIAMLLRVQTHLQAEQDQAREGRLTPELLAVLEPQQEALRRSVASVTARVESLERYAGRVQEADAALRAMDALGNNHKYQALLAHTDDAEGLRELENQGDTLQETLARSVRDAIEAGHTLQPGPPA
ncbi:hypothetical protein FE391_14795 [Nonomuraea sp. KC401]|uniref:Uncharacterized protein n=1 Tax=Nonomuraea longispora TaxID=1848320 RepID=A0A4R4N1U1_9ACTN|nr:MULTISPECIES: hypothetical protein [Nonomuraea]NBE99632.1 hypothetical protein [Nonomuraea sp. K271]TDC00667.1 hypothetical protein E1267_34030 [Nonomuraea longispora]TLF73868.1 hypothetical protein FE391_14795 [Nonomuraea sp. KC401]